MGAGLLALLVPALVLAPPAGAQVSDPPPSLVLSPSKVRTEAAGGLRMGPFGLRNDTATPYRVRVRPVLLGQDRAGDLIVRDDRRSLRRAARIIAPGTRSFRLPPGARGSSVAITRRPPPAGSFYGGLLFQAHPRAASSEQIVEILRLNASVLLDPPAAERSVRLGAGEMRGEEAGERGISLVLPVTNRGNAYLPVAGEARVLDQAGRTRATVDLRRIRLLPDATVDLRGRVAADLEPGTYSLRGTATMEDETVEARGELVIGADGRVEHRAASLGEVPAPTAYIGEPVEVEATYRNDGNVAFSPAAEVRARPLVEGSVGDVAAIGPLEADEAEPGESAPVMGSVELPGEAGSYELEIVLLDDERELDSASVGVTPQARAGLLEGIRGWIRRNALLLVLALGALLVGLAVGALAYVRRLRESMGGPPARPPRPAVVAPAPNLPRPTPSSSPAGAKRPVEVAGSNGSGKVSLAAATFDDLRALGMSVTQANRVLRHRDERGGFSSVDDLDDVPGIPRDLLALVKGSVVE